MGNFFPLVVSSKPVPPDYHLFWAVLHGPADQHFRYYEEVKIWIVLKIISKHDHFFQHYPKHAKKFWIAADNGLDHKFIIFLVSTLETTRRTTFFISLRSNIYMLYFLGFRFALCGCDVRRIIFTKFQQNHIHLQM